MSIELSNYVELLSKPSRLWSREEVLSSPSPVPDSAGAYAWYFKQTPRIVPTTDCAKHDGLTLLYVGISPAGESSGGTLQERLQTHYDGTARFSTLRLSLGCLLRDLPGIEFCRIGSVKKKKIRLTDTGEAALSDWMSENAFVTWAKVTKPWLFEVELIKEFKPPLNIKHNTKHPFYRTLRKLRSEVRKRAWM